MIPIILFISVVRIFVSEAVTEPNTTSSATCSYNSTATPTSLPAFSRPTSSSSSSSSYSILPTSSILRTSSSLPTSKPTYFNQTIHQQNNQAFDQIQIGSSAATIVGSSVAGASVLATVIGLAVWYLIPATKKPIIASPTSDKSRVSKIINPLNDNWV